MYEITERVLEERPTAVARDELEITQLDSWIGPALRRVAQAVATAGARPAGPPFARLLPVEDTAARFDVEAGFPVNRPIRSVQGAEVQPSRLPGGVAAVTVHEGPFEAVEPAHEALATWIADQGGLPDGSGWENYLNPPVGDPASWRTEVVQPYTAG